MGALPAIKEVAGAVRVMDKRGVGGAGVEPLSAAVEGELVCSDLAELPRTHLSQPSAVCYSSNTLTSTIHNSRCLSIRGSGW